MTVKQITEIINGRLLPTTSSLDADVLEVSNEYGNKLQVLDDGLFVNVDYLTDSTIFGPGHVFTSGAVNASVLGIDNTLEYTSGASVIGVSNTIALSKDPTGINKTIDVLVLGNQNKTGYEPTETYSSLLSNISIVGFQNSVKNSYTQSIFGYKNTVKNISASLVLGNDNTLTDSGATFSTFSNAIVGTNNTAKTPLQRCTMTGANNITEYTLTTGSKVISDSIILGVSNTNSNINNSVLIGNYAKNKLQNLTQAGTGYINVGSYGLITDSNYASAIGYSNTVTSSAYGSAIGSYNFVNTAEQGSALGYSNTVVKDRGVAVGYRCQVQGISGLSVGQESVATGEKSIAMGYLAKTYNLNCISIGSNTLTGPQDTIAIGTNAQTTTEQGVSIGYGSKTSIAKDTDGYLTGTSYLTGAKLAKSEFSVGDAATSYTRRVTNVADGVNNTDVVTVSQLKKARESDATIYNASGVVTAPKIFMGIAVANSDGDWSIDYTHVGFTTVPIVTASGQTTGTAVADRRFASLGQNQPTKTGCSGKLLSSSSAGLLAAMTMVAGAGNVNIIAIGY